MSNEEAIKILERKTTIPGDGVSFGQIEEAIEMAISALRDWQASNEPLTLDELREMDGEPVWVVSLDGYSHPCWMLVDVRYDLCREAHGGMAVFENNGKTWLAYRHGPVKEAR